jgi:predicted transposase/invertase (TIGR01784 family)
MTSGKTQHYNVEMQLFGSKVQLHRILYYWAVLHAGQLREGEKYTALQATISIAIVNSVLFPDVSDHHLDFQLRSGQHPQLVFSPQQSIHLLELPKFTKNADQLGDPLDVWCYFLIHGAEIDTEQMPNALKVPMVQRAMEVLDMLSHNEVERERYQARLKWERDQTAFIDEAREGGIQEGIQKGLQKGTLIGRIQLIEEWLRTPVTPEKELIGLSLNELQEQAEALEQQMRARNQ